MGQEIGMGKTMEATEKVWIPKVSKKRIKELFKRIKPVVRFARGAEGLFGSPKGNPHFIRLVDLFNIAYTWSAKPAGRVFGLKTLCDIRTYHSYGAPVFFKPSIAEVLAQIPEEHLDKVVAFEIVGPPRDANDLNREPEALNAGYHVAITRLYVKEDVVAQKKKKKGA